MSGLSAVARVSGNPDRQYGEEGMTKAAERIRSELSLLPAQDRAQLAHFLIHSLEGENDEDVEAAWDKELESRTLEIREGRADGEPAGQVFGELKTKYS